jgi:hypothetical protein
VSTYSKLTDFAAKDALLTGNPSKIVKGTEIGAEFDSIESADASNVKGPTSAVTDNAVVRWDTTTGRIAQGSGVTISDADVVTASGFSGPHNGTVGATTPSTGAFTTLSASGVATFNNSVTVNTGNAVSFKNTDGTASTNIGNNGGTGVSNLYVYVDGTTRAAFSSTGLSVTGALSASGATTFGGATATGIASGEIGFLNATALRWRNGANSAYLNAMYVDASNNQILGGNAVNSIVASVVGTGTVGTFSSTGLSVTGALSATNGVSETSGTVGVTSANGGGTARMIGVASGAFFGSTTAVDTVIQRNSAEIGRFSSTGLAVTGLVSATGSLGTVQTTSTGNRLSFTRNGANYFNSAGASSSINYAAPTHTFYAADEATVYGTFSSTGLEVGTKDLSTTTGALRFNQSGVRSWAINAASGNLNFGSGDGNGTFAFGSPISVTGTVSATTGAAVGGATAGSGGIAFPATAVAVADANTLDDYEEGTFTPTIVGTSTAGAGTYTTQVGRYQKVGNRVKVSITVAITAHTGTGNMLIGALPFTSTNVTSNTPAMAIAASNLTYSGQLSARINVNDVTIAIETFATGAALTGLAIDAACTLFVSGYYEV